MKSCLQNFAQWLLSWIGIFMFISQSWALDINSRFRVEQGQGPVTRSGSGTYGGTCYGTDADLSAIYTEAIDLAQVALDSLNSYATSATVRATVETFFGIKADSSSPTTVSAIDSAQFAYVKYIFGQIIAFSTGTEDAKISQPGFFCDDSWRWRTEMDYGSDGQMNGRTISQVTADGTPLRAALSTPGTLMHELAHLVTKQVVTDETLPNGQKAYFPPNVATLAAESKAKAVKNADTYTWFAIAMYLDQCDWSRQICAQSTSTSTVAKRSNNQTSTDMALMRRSNRRTFLPRVLTGLKGDSRRH
ncbi:hypothetical protein Y699_00110 [Aspergillus fumigatus Z5]|nr:hypothetical protein Y699_00110 [Aspergillus fumigatus Z5]